MAFLKHFWNGMAVTGIVAAVAYTYEIFPLIATVSDDGLYTLMQMVFLLPYAIFIIPAAISALMSRSRGKGNE